MQLFKFHLVCPIAVVSDLRAQFGVLLFDKVLHDLDALDDHILKNALLLIKLSQVRLLSKPLIVRRL